jgi:hypothetical protein
VKTNQIGSTPNGAVFYRSCLPHDPLCCLLPVVVLFSSSLGVLLSATSLRPLDPHGVMSLTYFSFVMLT